MSTPLLRAYTNQLLSLPKAEREQLAAQWKAERLADNAKREAEAEAKQAKLREQYGDWADDEGFFPF
jgi:regulator of protease activity HflC (stomatin/prohibitin superfamily)